MKIEIYGEIWRNGWETEAIAKTLEAANGELVEVHISSEGGDVVQGYGLAALIASYQGPTVAYIHGMCASIATLVALACDKVVMSEMGFFMIHNAYMPWAEGDKDQLQKDQKVLQTIDSSLAKAYKKKVMDSGKWGGSEEELEQDIENMMRAETWMTSEEAFEYGFINEIKEPAQTEQNLVTRAVAKAKDLAGAGQKQKPMAKKKKTISQLFKEFLGYVEAEEAAALEQGTEEQQTDDQGAEEGAAAPTDQTDEKQAEIEALKKQLEELMGQQTAMAAKLAEAQNSLANTAPYAKGEPTKGQGRAVGAEEIKRKNAYIKGVYK